MKEAIKLIAEFVNPLHDVPVVLSGALGFNLSDKDLHFWVIGVIGLVLFVMTEVIFKMLAKWSTTSIAFIYTVTVLLVIVFAIEIQQKITGRGNMEFADITIGLYGFFALALLYLLCKLFVRLVKKRFSRNRY
ncbi:hypothetical protein [Bacillus sp. T33-2]|uniref:hypothetical protein n=1 Tax=Bacillus sp. T33-2 TaxID=2054168 RepID=UPI000C75DF6B|nr:hypothetical protein [Bacillus sp. T33-2]PLR91231.1 hypothetical protein CVD19_21820 [Bacillus sp. T33-2]